MLPAPPVTHPNLGHPTFGCSAPPSGLCSASRSAACKGPRVQGSGVAQNCSSFDLGARQTASEGLRAAKFGAASWSRARREVYDVARRAIFESQKLLVNDEQSRSARGRLPTHGMPTLREFWLAEIEQPFAVDW